MIKYGIYANMKLPHICAGALENPNKTKSSLPTTADIMKLIPFKDHSCTPVLLFKVPVMTSMADPQKWSRKK
jgi:hypothetical protein